MVANLSNYRPPSESSRFNGSSSGIETLRRFLCRRTEAAFLVRGYDRSFCEVVTDEAMLAIHADIDECDLADFREWAAQIAVRIGFEEIRKLHVIQARLLKNELSKKSKAAAGSDCDQPQHSELEEMLLGDKAENEMQVAQDLLRLHREMVRGILDGKCPLYVISELNLSPDFQQMFISEAVRKLNLLRRRLRSEFKVPRGIR